MQKDLNVYYTNFDQGRGTHSPNTDELPFETIANIARTRGYVKKIVLYRDVFLYAPTFESISRPFFTLVVLRLMAWRHCVLIDAQNRRRRIGIFRIFIEFFQFLYQHCTYQNKLPAVEAEVERMERIQPVHFSLDLHRTPVYLYCGFSYGHTAGGSVGHIAGVLNHLDKVFYKSPIFLTTDTVPSLTSNISCRMLHERIPYGNLYDIPQLLFNEIIYDRSIAALQGENVSMICQRNSLNVYAGVKLAYHLNVPLVLEYNGSDIWCSNHWGGRRLRSESLAKRIEYLAFSQAALIVCVSQPLKDQLVEMGIPERKILVNPNGVDEKQYCPQIDGMPVRQKYGIKQEEIVIGFIGTFGAWHGAEVLARAFAQLVKREDILSKLRLLLIGDGARMDAVKDILNSEDVLKECVLTGVVPQEKGATYLAACDILVSPQVPNPDGSPFFGSPTKLFEYMAMGKAIAASDLDQIGAVLEHEKTALLCTPGDVSVLENTLARLVSDSMLREHLGKNAREEAVKKYTWMQHTKRTVDYLKTLCK